MSYHLGFFNNTIIIQDRYIIIETKEVARIGYNGFLFPHSYECRKRNRYIQYVCFNSTVSYTYLFTKDKIIYTSQLPF